MLALICGRGALPFEVAQRASAPPLICALDGFAPDGLPVDVTLQVERIAAFFDTLTSQGVDQVCFCGAITRVNLDPAKIEPASMAHVQRLAMAMGKGDDGALREVLALFEEAGFAIRAAQEVAPDLLAKAGVLTLAAPTEAMEKDAARGFDVLTALAPMDTGQGCVVGGGQVLGIETLGGTDHMLSTLPDAPQKAKGIFVKAPKAGQDYRVDWPTIGPDTIDALVSAGLAGMALDAGGALILDRAAVVAAADAAGLTLWVRSPET